VRRCAHTLRLKLEEAYATDLARARVRIELPRGGYQPRFHLAERPSRPKDRTAATGFGAPLLMVAFALALLAGGGRALVLAATPSMA